MYRMRELTSGNQDSQWITLEGLVRNAEEETIWNHRVLVLTLDTGVGTASARILDFAGDVTRLVDAMVRVRGVCGTVYNGRRQFIGLRMFVPSLREILIMKPGYRNPYDAPLRKLNALLRFGQGSAPYHLVLMDVQMPLLGGFGATAIIRENEKKSGNHVKIIAQPRMP